MVVMGRKNYLFMGADSGGQRAAETHSTSVHLKISGHFLSKLAYPLRGNLRTLTNTKASRQDHLRGVAGRLPKLVAAGTGSRFDFIGQLDHPGPRPRKPTALVKNKVGFAG
jgi:hypothetical protein